MTWIRIAAATVNQTPMDWEGNVARCRAAVDQARREGAEIVVLPELAITGYGCEDAFHGIAHTERAMRHLEEFGKCTRGLVVIVGTPLRLQHGLYNGAAVFADGRLVGIVCKQNLAGDGVHYEPRWFRPWRRGSVVYTQVGDAEIPVGDLMFDFGGVRLGIEICEDAWVADRPAVQLARAGVDIVAVPTASHFAFGKGRTRERLIAESSRATASCYVFANLLGNEAGRMIFPGDRVIAVHGEPVARGERLSFREWSVISAVVDVDLLRMRRQRTMSLKSNDDAMHLERVAWRWRGSSQTPTSPIGPPVEWEQGTDLKAEEFSRAVALGLFDYMRKSRSRGFVVSLSGGADSAAVAALASLAIRMARAELGDKEVARRLSYLKLDLASASGGLLDTVYQASANSGDFTRKAAATIAQGIGARHSEWDIQAMVEHATSMVESTLGRKMTWGDDDIALQNIQARVRAPGVWMLANVRNALLLSTSNRSEAAVGYATMDGDTSGSIAPIAGIDKNYLRTWLKWLSETGPQGIGPIPQVAVLLEAPPTAELRPPHRKQTDEADLMPYDLLDAIEGLAIRDRLEPAEVLAHLKDAWSKRVGGEKALRGFITRFYRLWARNQWKRERYAPSFHLDDKNLDPKTWCRFPILSGGFDEELGEIAPPKYTDGRKKNQE
jgi:NAD+ synthase (glutamine-hydrolysing)